MKNVVLEMEKSWRNQLKKELSASYFKDLIGFLENEYEQEIIYPDFDLIFNAFNLTPFNDLKVVVIGQDPYHGVGQANGLSFSVNKGIKIPPSLKNIYKELNSDIGLDIPSHGDLTSWAKQGVLLLNSTLTVKKGQPASHQKKGWEIFTDNCIKVISEEKSNVVFMLWGNFAKEKERLINTSKHLVLKSVHPSPFSARNGFFGCEHFSKANNFLEETGQLKIDWSL